MFGSIEQVLLEQEYAICARLAPVAVPHLHDEQRRIGTGDAFIIGAAWERRKIAAFGLVMDPDLAGGISPQIAQVMREQSTILREEHGILVGTMARNTHGRARVRPHVSHQIWSWPITHEVYAAAMDAKWLPDQMEEGARAHLSIALQAYSGHQLALKRQGVRM